MGRRPLVRSQAPQVPVAGFTPEVQKAVNDIALTLLESILPKLKARIEAGELDAMDLKGLMSEARKMMSAAKGPSTSITAIQIPTAPQGQEPTARKARIIEAAKDPEALAELRKSAQRHAERRTD